MLRALSCRNKIAILLYVNSFLLRRRGYMEIRFCLGAGAIHTYIYNIDILLYALRDRADPPQTTRKLPAAPGASICRCMDVELTALCTALYLISYWGMFALLETWLKTLVLVQPVARRHISINPEKMLQLGLSLLSTLELDIYVGLFCMFLRILECI